MIWRFVLHNLCRRSCDDIHLLLVRVSAREEDVVEHFVAVESVALCDLHDALRTTTCDLFPEKSQGTLGVQEDHFPVGSMPSM